MLKLLSLNFKFIYLVILLNLALILYIYWGVFSLELQGDTWQYAWAYIKAYGNAMFNEDFWRNMRTSLGGSTLTFDVIKDLFGLNALAYYSIAVLLKFISVILWYLFINKLCRNGFVALVCSLLLSASFAGVEATHWVFNMYAYIGLIFITSSIYIGLNLPTNFNLKTWSVSFLLACLGVWYATMRTSGFIIIILAWSLYKLVTLRSKNSLNNLIFWFVGFIIFILIDKFLLGQMESDYSQKYIIGVGFESFWYQINLSKFDFLLSPTTNLGVVLLPDMTWFNLDFPKSFSFLGSSQLRSVIMPSLFIFGVITWVITGVFSKRKDIATRLTPKFFSLFSFGLLWTLVVYLVLKQGPLNFTSWINLALTLFGGYFMIICTFLVLTKELPTHLKDLFLITLLWSTSFLLLPLFMNGGPVLGTYHRYLITTGPSVPLFLAGILTLGYYFQSKLLRVTTLCLIVLMIFSHAVNTKAFFDNKALAHNRFLANNIWQKFTEIVPNKIEFSKSSPPILWFESAENQLDKETLFETLYFGFLFRTSLKYGWDPHMGTGLYYENYPDLVKYIKANPKSIVNLYGIRMEQQSLVNVTEKIKQKLLLDEE